jgi:hypothetical protein
LQNRDDAFISTALSLEPGRICMIMSCSQIALRARSRIPASPFDGAFRQHRSGRLPDPQLPVNY